MSKENLNHYSDSSLLETNDAKVWAEAFEKAKNINGWNIDDIDEGLMLAWFANAMTAQEFSKPKPRWFKTSSPLPSGKVETWYGWRRNKEDTLPRVKVVCGNKIHSIGGTQPNDPKLNKLDFSGEWCPIVWPD